MCRQMKSFHFSHFDNLLLMLLNTGLFVFLAHSISDYIFSEFPLGNLQMAWLSYSLRLEKDFSLLLRSFSK